VELHEEIRGVEEVGEALGGERAGAGVLVLEVVVDPPERFGGATRGTAGTVPLDLRA
jgi:hypothetical protein